MGETAVDHTARRRPGAVRAVTAGAAALALATTGTAAGSPGTTGPARQLPWDLKGCAGVIALLPATPEQVAPFLPPGFTAVLPPSVAATLPPDPRLRAALGVEAFRCESGQGLEGPVAGMVYGSAFTFVRPPAALAGHGQDLAFVKWDTLVPDEPRRRVLVEAGLPVAAGDVQTSGNEAAAGPQQARLSSTTLTVGPQRHVVDAASAAPTPFEGSFVEFQQGRDGLTTWTTRFRATQARGGAAVVRLDPASVPARALGRQQSDAYLLSVSGLDFTAGTIRLPGAG